MIAGGRGVLLIGHGTRSDAGTAEFFQLADQLRPLLPGTAIEAAFLELRRPSIADAWQRLAAQRVQRIDAVPLLLFAAGHAKQDIPAALAACAAAAPHVTLRVSAALSRHPSLVALAAARVGEAVRDAAAADGAVPRDTRRTALVVVGRGNHDPCARTDLRLLVATMARVLGRQLPLARVEAAFYAMAAPRLPEVLAAVAADPAVDTVIVQPLLLFDGQVKASIQQQVADAAERHPRLRFRVTEHLGAHPLLAEAVAGRLANVAGNIP